jgi:dolichol-phosphate mannosyltransferase
VSSAPGVELAVIIPTFNERANVLSVLRCLAEALPKIKYEVIFVDDDSPDGTADLISAITRENSQVRLIHRVNRRGLASACVEGMLSTSAPYLAVMDADLQHDERILPEMLRTLQNESLDIVVGSRNITGGGMGEFASWRVALSMWGRRLGSLVCRCEIADPMSGFFVVRREFFMEAVHRISGVGFKILLDLLASARRAPRLREIPYRFRSRLRGESKLDILAGVEYFKLLLDKTAGNFIPPSFLLFALVGAVGAALYFGVFALALFVIRTSFNTAQISAAATAMTANFFLNNAVTFRNSRLKGRRIIPGLLSFYAACSIGIWINRKMAHAAGAAGAEWYSAGLLGLGAGFIWNYGVTQMFTWGEGRRRTSRAGRMPAAASVQFDLKTVEANEELEPAETVNN